MKCPECELDNRGDPTHCRYCKTALRETDAATSSDACDGCGKRWVVQAAGNRFCIPCYEAFLRLKPEHLPPTCRMVVDPEFAAQAAAERPKREGAKRPATMDREIAEARRKLLVEAKDRYAHLNRAAGMGEGDEA